MSLPDDVLQDIRFQIVQGFSNRETVFEHTIVNHAWKLGVTQEEFGLEDFAPDTLAALRDAIESAFVEFESAAATWPSPTDCERLRAAFDVLDGLGIVALENAGLTQEDGIQLAARVARARDELGERRGHAYCCFSWNDLTRAIEGGGLSLAYGTFEEELVLEPPPPCTKCGGRGWVLAADPSQGALLCSCRTDPPVPTRSAPPSLGEQIGAEVLRACREAGLPAEWDGQGSSFVRIPRFEWRRRPLPVTEAALTGFLESWELEVRAGYSFAFARPEVLRERAEDWFSDFTDFGPAILRRIQEHADAFLADEHERERRRVEPTVNDRIRGAFEDLGSRGVLALECAGMTLEDGWAYAGLELEAQRGVVFFHREDVFDALHGRGLRIAFGAVGVDAEVEQDATVIVARETLAALRRHGVACEWSGSVRDRLRVAPFPWSRRRWTTPPLYETVDPGASPDVPSEPSSPIATLRAAGEVVRAVRDESGFDAPRSRRVRATWTSHGLPGEAQLGHVGLPHAFVQAGDFTSVAPRLSSSNLGGE
jgi:hypothetical protein